MSITNCDRTAVYDAPPQRIVSMNDHVTETLIQMGVGDRIVGMGYGDKDDPLPDTAEQFRCAPFSDSGEAEPVDGSPPFSDQGEIATSNVPTN